MPIAESSATHPEMLSADSRMPCANKVNSSSDDLNDQDSNAVVSVARSAALVDGSVLSGGLDPARDTEFDNALRDQSLSGQ